MAKPSKRDAILETASRLFIEQGFQAISMDQLAAAVPVSKPTLYAHFHDKRDLFTAVIGNRCSLALAALKQGVAMKKSDEDGLLIFARHLLGLILSPESIKLHRVVIGESANFPDMAQLFYECGPKQMRQFLMTYLEQLNGQNGRVFDQPDLSADLFLGMMKSRMHLQCVLGLRTEKPTQAEIEAFITHAVRVFLKGHEET